MFSTLELFAQLIELNPIFSILRQHISPAVGVLFCQEPPTDLEMWST